MPHSLVRLSNDDEVRSRVVPVAPFVHDSGQLPFSGLSHADFEILLADLYREKLGSSESRWNWYDEVIRINNGADNGVDVLLTLSNQTAGVVQCKHYTSTNVGIDTVRKELLALVLRSFIIPELVSPQALPFHYILAVSDNVTKDTLSFFTQSGKPAQDFATNIRDYERLAVGVRNEFSLLRNDTAMSELTGPELFARALPILLRFEFHLWRRDNLSSVVRSSRNLMDIYFTRETVTSSAEVDALLQQMFPDRAVLAASGSNRILNVHTHYCNRDLLGAEKLYTCLIHQKHDAALATIADLFQNHFRRLAGDRPVCILAGSGAFRADDFDVLDEMVSNYPGPLILQVGCEAVSGSQLNSWRQRALTFPDGEGALYPADSMFRTGWCWVKESPESEQCFLLLENVHRDAGYDQGTHTLRIAYNDVIVWCALTADFYPATIGDTLLCERILIGMNDDPFHRHQLLMVSSDGPVTSDVINNRGACFNRLQSSGAFSVLLCHNSVGDISDDLRRATGFFPLEGDSALLHRCPSVSALHLLRNSFIAAGFFIFLWPARVSRATILNVYLWQNVDDELYELSYAVQMELERFFDAPNAIGQNPIINQGIEQLRKKIIREHTPHPDYLVHQALFGTARHFSPDLTNLVSRKRDVLRVIKALCYFTGTTGTHWLSNSEQIGQLCTEVFGGRDNVLAWDAQDRSFEQLQSELIEWIREGGEHPDLLVFAHVDGRVTPEACRVDTSMSRASIAQPDDVPGSITEPQASRKVWVYDLMDLVQRYNTGNTVSERDNYLRDLSEYKNTVRTVLGEEQDNG